MSRLKQSWKVSGFIESQSPPNAHVQLQASQIEGAGGVRANP
jgi:hypothetical protein